MSTFLERTEAKANGREASPAVNHAEAIFPSVLSSPVLSIHSGVPDTGLLPNGISQQKQTCELGSLDFRPFSISMVDANRKEPGVFGIGWATKRTRARHSRCK